MSRVAGGRPCRLIAVNDVANTIVKHDRIHGAGTHLLQLIDQVLELTKIDAGRMGTLLAEVRAAAQPLVSEHALEFAIRGDADCLAIHTDHEKLVQIRVKLLNNAFKFTKHGRVTIALSASRLGEQEALSFAVSDTDMGMSDTDLARIYHPFLQGDQSTTCTAGGTGLGLTIVYHFVELLGGEILAESKLGCGTTVTVTLPMRSPSWSRPEFSDPEQSVFSWRPGSSVSP